jgi:lipopolysaccharide/colanic/teichoic acid biosynthesis glycosyltransferase
MEPDILASVGDLRATPARWTDANIIQPEDPASVETPTDISKPSDLRLHAVSALAPVAVPRGRVHAGGFSSGHARPRATSAARTVARETVHAQTGVMPFDTPAPQGFYLRFGKRAIDILGSGVALLLLLPIIAVLAVIVKLTSRGPVFYRSTRIGRGGRPFTFYKLRSMVKDADLKRQTIAHMNEADGPVFKIQRDPRITGIGRFMRSTSLDEVPQFWNILKGDMSLVGPRPPIPQEVAQYEPWQLRRLDVLPGLTCLWQISGRSRIGFQEWMRLDLEYIRHQSFQMDLKILLRTIPAVLSREGAY